MSHSPFRFLHAADLHLERPLASGTEAPDHLRGLFCEAPYSAAQQVFDAALAEQVDFVVLAGDVLDATLCGPRGPIFMIEQFRRLADLGIAVYWAGGQVDPPSRWPADLPLPENVRVFPQDRVEQVVHHRGGLPLCNLAGLSSGRRKITPGDFRTSPTGRLNIAVAYGRADAGLLRKEPIAYWALGGRHRASTQASPRQIAHYPGTPQGRQPGESGPHGCTLVEVDAQGQLRTRRLTCDALRWQTLEVRVDEHTRRDQLEDLLRERLREQQGENAHPLLVSWNIVGHGPLWNAVRRGGLAAELLNLLRREFSASAWTVALSSQPPAYYADAVADQETLLGDYLRRVRQYQTQPELPLELSGFLDRPTKNVPAALWRLDDPATRQHVLREAAALGVEVLKGDWGADHSSEV